MEDEWAKSQNVHAQMTQQSVSPRLKLDKVGLSWALMGDEEAVTLEFQRLEGRRSFKRAPDVLMLGALCGNLGMLY